MAIINKPFPDFEAVTTAESAKVNADFNSLYAEFNGNITDPNISAAAAIQQSKILNLVGDLNVIRGERVAEVNFVAFGANGTYTKPADLLFLHVIVIGGGGGGGGAKSDGALTASSGGGGGSGSISESWLAAAAIGATETITIGAGGAGGLGITPSDGLPGGATTFGALVGANGGHGGQANLNSIGGAGIGGVSGGGNLSVTGQRGLVGFITTAPGPIAVGGNGGWLGPYQQGGTPSPTADLANGGQGALGGGGAGAATAQINTADGGAGGSGLIIIIEFKA